MSRSKAPTALIAEDEPLLAAALKAELAVAWPGLRVLATVGDGATAVAQSLALQPDVLFFDIQMPGLSGLDAAAELLDAWPEPAVDDRGVTEADIASKPFPALVFVTAYDQYAVAAFEAQAIDYLLKPVQPARLLKTVQKVQLAQQMRARTAISTIAIEGNQPEPALDQTLAQTLEHSLAQSLAQTLAQTLAQVRALLAARAPTSTAPPLQVISASQAGSPGTTRLVPIADVLYFDAADKYMRVLTADAEFLIRTPLKELIPQLDGNEFWQIHRGTLVRASAVHAAHRDDNGKMTLSLAGRPEKLPVSRLYAHLFKAM